MPLSFTNNAQVVLEKRYLLRNAEGVIIETPQKLFQRVARFVAEGDLQFERSISYVANLTDRFYEIMASGEFMPNSPTLMNAGKPSGQLSACFVLPVEDSLEEIFDTLKHAALIHQSGGGTGFSFSKLRPRGDRLRHTSGVTSGPISFMEVYNVATEAIKQGGTRRGANMGILRIDHPDIEEFITLKNDLARMTNFNLSIAITDGFMQAVEANLPFPLIHPGNGSIVRTLSAKELMQKVVESAWKTGEPGIVFIDRINSDNPTPGLGEIESTNPCGEVPLLPYEACNLGSINMGKMLKVKVDGNFEIDWEKFRITIEHAIHFLENVIVQNTFPLAEIQKMVEGNRKIGLGLMGWADALILLGIPYDSEKAVSLASEIMAFLSYHSKLKSVNMAKERGRFPFFNKSVYTSGTWFSDKYKNGANEAILHKDWVKLDQEIADYGIRNATTTAIAPTGTISIISDASGGIEPLYALTFVRNVMENSYLTETNSIFKSVLQARKLYCDKLMEDISKKGSIQSFLEIPQDIREIFVTSYDIAPFWHVRMQVAFQHYSDNAVSKTINFSEAATIDDIEETYKLAYNLGAKGITVYRNGSRKLQPMSIESNYQLSKISSQYCPDCQKPLQLIEGCFQCSDCRYAYCG